MERVPLEKKVLNENDRIAAALRARFLDHGVLALNFISSPGSGKTSLLEKTLESFSQSERVAVLTGDIQTDNDARRLARFGFPVKQITTGGTCHLDARMIERGLEAWRLEDIDLLLIENVGIWFAQPATIWEKLPRSSCSASPKAKTSRSNIPIFFKSELLVLNKVDLLPFVPFDIAAAAENARRVHPEIEIVRVSSLTCGGIRDWMGWLEQRRDATTPARQSASDGCGMEVRRPIIVREFAARCRVPASLVWLGDGTLSSPY